MAIESCEMCGATESLTEDEDHNGRRVWLCSTGDCGFEWERMLRDDYQAEYERELEELNDRYWR